MSSRRATQTRREWLTSLASLTYPQLPGMAAEAFVAYLPHLADFPDGAFTERSLMAVVNASRKMAIPSLDEVIKPLGKWWREHRPIPALAAPATEAVSELTEEQRLAVRDMLRRAAAAAEEGTPASRRPNAVPPLPRGQVSDGQLLASYQQLAAQGDTLAASRVKGLLARLQAETEARLTSAAPPVLEPPQSPPRVYVPGQGIR